MSKPFNLKAALAGAPVETRDGRKVTELYHLKTFTGPCPVVAVIDGTLNCYYTDGRWLASSVSGNDLAMTTKKRQVWHGVFKKGDVICATAVYISKKALDNLLDDMGVEVIQIYCTEWEE